MCYLLQQNGMKTCKAMVLHVFIPFCCKNLVAPLQQQKRVKLNKKSGPGSKEASVAASLQPKDQIKT